MQRQEYRVSILICLVFYCAFVYSQTTCSNSDNKINCGFFGITQSECVANDCCWYEVNPNPDNLPWCFYPNQGTPQCDSSRSRKDCGYDGITQSECENQGCCWNEVNPNPSNLPWCFFSNELILGYQVTSSSSTPTGMTLTLTAIDPSEVYGPAISPLEVLVEMDTNDRLHVKIYDPNADRWEIPQSIIPRSPPTSAPTSPKYSFSYTEYPFGFAVTRKSDMTVIFNSTIPSGSSEFDGLIFKDQYLSISTILPPSSAIFGFEESTKSAGFKLEPNSQYTLWNRDTPPTVTNQNLYGSHPFYLSITPNGQSSGVLLLSSNGMDVMYGDNYLTYNIIGGVLDFYFFLGPSGDDVVSQYSSFIGLPHLQPYWSFGFHQSKYGYPNIQYLEQVVANYSAANIPLDTMWSDIDYMNIYEDFTWSPTNYPVSSVQSFTTQLHDDHQQYVIILDPGIKNDDTYSSYNALISSGAYIKDASGNPFVGQVWPGYTIFPDFINPNGQTYWEQQINAVLTTVPYDGLWVDMNEISNFCSGECLNGPPIPLGSTTCGCTSPTLVTPSSEYLYYYGADFDPVNPPYAINNDNNHDPLNTKTLDMNAMHNGTLLEYNVHNLYGLTEAKTTKQTLESYYNKRSFVLSRSTFPSSGHWTAHWSGDNNSDYIDMWYSILGLLNFNILGVPMMGSDICGFNGNTTMELCARWIELGSFYPFCRNHDSISSTNQELYLWPQVSEISQFILRVRYSLIPLFYTLNYLSSTTGSSIIRPLFFQFPTDTQSWSIDSQFLVGKSLMIVPVLTEGATSVMGYFPEGIYYNFYNYQNLTFSVGSYLSLDAPLQVIPVFILGGTIFARSSFPQLTTYETRMSPFNVTVALNSTQQASGSLYLDDGESINPTYSYVEFFSSVVNGKGELYSNVVSDGYNPGTSGFSTSINDIAILGVTSVPTAVTVNNANFSGFTFSAGVLSLPNVSLNVNTPFTINWE